MSNINKDLLSAKKQYLIPVEGNIVGEVPEWMKGSLYRNGPGLYEFGEDKFKHLFDGMAMIQRYHIENGRVTFNSQYVNSRSYLLNKAMNRIVVSEFGTRALPDPCRTIFDRMSSMFKSEPMTDNTCVTILPVGDELFAATETNVIHRFDQEDLSTLGTIRLDKVVAVHRATAHFHIDKESKSTILLGMVNSPISYALVEIPAISHKDAEEISHSKYEVEKLVKDSKIISQIKARWKMYPSYFHSFGMTENYFILLESTLTINLLEVLKSMALDQSFAKSFKWWDNEYTKVIVINRKTGQEHTNLYYTDALFTFHHINAYEDNNQIFIDICAYDNGDIILDLLNDNIKNKKIISKVYVKRIVVPLNTDEYDKETKIIALKDTECVAKVLEVNAKTNKKTIHISLEQLSQSPYELPTINYDFYNGRKFRYSYGVSDLKFMKLDHQSKTEFSFEPDYENIKVNEGIFLPHPDADPNKPEDEDWGIVLCPIIIYDDSVDTGRYQNLYFLDAKSMKEIARAEFKSVSIPLTFHGLFKEN